MLGARQLQWLETTLLQAQQDRIPWKFVAISSPIDQVGGAPVQEGKSWWGGYRAERDRLLKFIADHRIGHVVFLTTDDHQTRVTHLQYLTNPADPNSKALLTDAFQVVTGPIGAGGERAPQLSDRAGGRSVSRSGSALFRCRRDGASVRVLQEQARHEIEDEINDDSGHRQQTERGDEARDREAVTAFENAKGEAA